MIRPTLLFTNGPESVCRWLDGRIEKLLTEIERLDNAEDESEKMALDNARVYADALQSVRIGLFGEAFDLEKARKIAGSLKKRRR